MVAVRLAFHNVARLVRHGNFSIGHRPYYADADGFRSPMHFMWMTNSVSRGTPPPDNREDRPLTDEERDRRRLRPQ